MKLTLAAFLLAFGLMVVVTALPQRVEPEVMQRALELGDIGPDGIDTVSIVGGRVHVTVGDRLTPRLSWPSDGDCNVETRRDGSTLHANVVGGCGYHNVTMALPAGISRIDGESLDIDATGRIDTLAIHVRHSLNWTGNARRLLVVEDPGEWIDCTDGAPEFCRTDIDISDANIDELDISTHDGKIALKHARGIGHATLRLGPTASFSLGAARSVDNIEVISTDDD